MTPKTIMILASAAAFLAACQSSSRTAPTELDVTAPEQTAMTARDAFLAQGAEQMSLPQMADETGETIIMTSEFGVVYYTPDGRKVFIRSNGERTDRRWHRRGDRYCEELVRDATEICAPSDIAEQQGWVLGNVARVFNDDGSLRLDGVLSTGVAPGG